MMALKIASLVNMKTKAEAEEMSVELIHLMTMMGLAVLLAKMHLVHSLQNGFL